jgi:Flp pilus assembly protein CpaB
VAAAGLAAGSLAAALQVLAPRPVAGEPVVVAAHEVPAGAVLVPGDLTVVRRAASQVPSGAMSDRSAVVGRTIGSGLRPGELLTDARLVGPGLLVGRPPGEVAAPVRIADGAATDLVRAGDLVDVLQASGEVGTAAGVVAGVDDPSGGGSDGGPARASGGSRSGGGSGGATGDDRGLFRSGGGAAGDDAGRRGSGSGSGRASGGESSGSRLGLSSDRTAPRARTVVRRATVLARPASAGGGRLLPEADPSAGGLVVLAVDEREAAALAEAAALGPLSLVLH